MGSSEVIVPMGSAREAGQLLDIGDDMHNISDGNAIAEAKVWIPSSFQDNGLLKLNSSLAGIIQNDTEI